MSEILSKYVNTVQNAHKSFSKEQFNDWIFDYTIQLCEENDLCDLFVSCKLNPSAFYAFAKYKSGNESIEKLEKNLIAGNCITTPTVPLTKEGDTK